MSPFRSLLWMLIGVLGCTSSLTAQLPKATPEGMSFNHYFDLLAEEIRFFLDAEKKGDATIAVAFTGPPTWATSGSNRLVEELKASLRRHKIKVASPANYAFKGEYKLSKTGKLHIQGTLVDRLGEVPAQWTPFPPCAEIDAKIISTVLGLSVDLIPRPGMKHEAAVRGSYVNPSIAITGEQKITARPSLTSPFGVRVLVNKQPKPLTVQGGLAFVALDLDDAFELEVLNDAAYEAASAVSIDGLSIFHFSTLRKERPKLFDKNAVWEGEPRYRYYIFGKKTSGLVQGWEKDERTVRAFKIVPFEESAAVQSGQTTDIGMITVSFHASWEKDKSVAPRDEQFFDEGAPTPLFSYRKNPVTKPDGSKGFEWQPVQEMGTHFGTGFGQDLLVNSQGVEREVGATRGLVTIRYSRKTSAAK